MDWPESITQALRLPRGARFRKCALQVNPYDYLLRHARPKRFKDEAQYNAAIVKACQDNQIEAIALMDHYRVKTSEGLRTAAQQAGIRVFPGFEAVTKDGVHILCLFEPDEPIERLERVLGDCGIHDNKRDSPTGKYDVTELLEESRKWKAVCVAAHVASPDGLLGKLKGQGRINAWRHPDLHAVSLPGPIKDAPEGLRPILENKDAQHRRGRPISILNAKDVNAPDDLANPSASCWIKMSEFTIDGLHQAFLDPESRVRLASDAEPEEHAEFRAITWQGGFLDGSKVQFSENLNVLIGGRGAGKSTVVESIRYVLDLEPLGEDARKAHDGIIRQVLRSGTKISLLVRSHRPSEKEYIIERTIPNPPVVRDKSGTILNLAPIDVIPRVELYGQHEVSELTKSPEKLTRLLARFVERDPNLARRKREILSLLERSRSRILSVQKELVQAVDRLEALPVLVETLKRFQEAGLEDRLKEQSLLVREERVLRAAEERLTPPQEAYEQLRRSLPIDRAFLSEKSIANLPGREILGQAQPVLERFERALNAAAAQIAKAIEDAKGGLAGVRAQWEERRSQVQQAYERILRELQKSRVDGEEFIRLRHQIEELRPLKERQAALEGDAKELAAQRRSLLAEWEDVKASEYREFERAAKKVSRRLEGRVRVTVAFAGNRERLIELVRSQIPGRLSEALAVLKLRETLSLKEFADACRDGRDALVQKFQIPPAQAGRLAQADPSALMALEELDLPSTTLIELNVAVESDVPAWKALGDLSTGQKATAVLLLLLLESDAPLVVDQPEDDLDNRFITEGIVPKIREEKRRRQFIFATHNANVPVLGDAEMILGLRASGEASGGTAEIPIEHMGSIDARPVRELVEELLEGGKEAFETRRLKYGF